MIEAQVLSVTLVYDFRKITAGVKGVFAEEFQGARNSGRTDNIRSTVANAECYLNYEKPNL